MEYLGYIFGLIAFVWCCNLDTQVEKLKRTLKENNIVNSEKTSLKEILEKNIGKRGKITLESDAADYDITAKHCIIQDIDEDWVQLEVEKSGIQKLIRIESIKSIQFK